MRFSYTIGTKLMAAVGAMMALTVALNYYSLASISAFKAQFDNAIDNTVTRLTLAGAITTENAQMAAAQKGMILSAFTKDTAGLENNIREFRQSMALMRKSLDQIRLLLITDEDKRLGGELDASED